MSFTIRLAPLRVGDADVEMHDPEQLMTSAEGREERDRELPADRRQERAAGGADGRAAGERRELPAQPQREVGRVRRRPAHELATRSVIQAGGRHGDEGGALERGERAERTRRGRCGERARGDGRPLQQAADGGVHEQQGERRRGLALAVGDQRRLAVHGLLHHAILLVAAHVHVAGGDRHGDRAEQQRQHESEQR